MMAAIVLVDASVFLNILNVPSRNQHRSEVFAEFEEMINAGDHFLLPMAAIIETGRHIAYLADGRQRWIFAQDFVERVTEALEGSAPWKPTDFPKKEIIHSWLNDFPANAMRGLSFTDHAIIKEWDQTCARHPSSRVRIWTLDDHLNGYDRRP